MGIFDALFGSKKRTNVELLPDQIWMTTEAKFAGLLKDADDRPRSDTVAILLVAHFGDVLARLEDLVRQRSWHVPCQTVLANNLDTDLAVSLNVDESTIIDIIVGERHPLPSLDDGLEAFADHLPCRCRFSHHLSLEDAVMQTFGGEWVQNILRNLGISEDEAIERNLVSRRIRRAQQKIEGRASGSRDAESAEQWLEKNCPELGKSRGS